MDFDWIFDWDMGVGPRRKGRGRRGPRRRFFKQGEVRLALLSLLKDDPGHGYELMKRLEERSGGLYRASAGTIYPVLQQLEDEGLVKIAEEEGKKVYHLTDAGRPAIGRRQGLGQPARGEREGQDPEPGQRLRGMRPDVRPARVEGPRDGRDVRRLGRLHRSGPVRRHGGVRRADAIVRRHARVHGKAKSFRYLYARCSGIEVDSLDAYGHCGLHACTIK